MKTELEATESRPGGRTLISASVEEERHGVRIARGVQMLLAARAFSYDPELSTAALDPPAPFSGSAWYRSDAGRAKGWRGDLTVDLPGRANVPLTRFDRKATLVPGRWSFGPPEFE